MTLAFGISSFRLNSIRLCKRSNFTWKVFIFKLSASFPMCDCFKLDIISHFSLQGEVLYHPNSISERILRCQQNASEKKELKSGCFPFLYLCLSLSLSLSKESESAISSATQLPSFKLRCVRAIWERPSFRIWYL